MGSRLTGSGDREFENYGQRLNVLLDLLRVTPAWSEIAAYHKIADLVAARVGLEKPPPVPSAMTPPERNDLLRAAIWWHVDPNSFVPEVREVLRTLVINAEDQRWVLRPEERQRLVRVAGSLEVLRRVRGPDPSTDTGQQVIDAILRGPRTD